MEVSCPRCRAHLMLPAAVIGQAVCCPSCRAVLRAESGRLVPPDVPAPPPPTEKHPATFDRRDDDLDLATDDELSDQRAARACERLYRAALCLRAAAVANVGVVLAIAFLANLHHHRGLQVMHAPEPGVMFDVDSAVAGSFCGLCLIGPFSVILWAAGGRFISLRLQGPLPQGGLVACMLASSFAGFCTLIAIVNIGARAPVSDWVVVSFAALGSGVTLFATIYAALARRDAIRLRLTQRLDDDVAEWNAAPSTIGIRARDLMENGARGLRRAAAALLAWYPVGCCTVAVAHEAGNLEQLPSWTFFAWIAGTIALALLLAGAHCLQHVRSREPVIVAVGVAAVVAMLFAFAAINNLWFTPNIVGGGGSPWLWQLVRAAVACVIAVLNLYAAINAWHVLRDPEVRQAFR